MKLIRAEGTLAVVVREEVVSTAYVPQPGRDLQDVQCNDVQGRIYTVTLY